MDCVFRKSTYKDIPDIADLLLESFGGMAIHANALSNVDGRYVLLFDDNKLVAMSGVLPLSESDFDGYEITFTCTLASERNKGYMSRLFEYMLNDFDISYLGKPLYICAWNRSDRAFLDSILCKNGFSLVRPDYISRNSAYSKICSCCLYDTMNCKCCDDLYLRQVGF